MTAKQIISEIQKANLNADELRTINGFVIDILKAERRVSAAMAKATLQVGMTVRVNHPKLAGRTFELTSIMRTKASVKPIGERFGGYNVPLSLVEQA